MGMPSLNITFQNVAQTVLRRSQRGIVAAILLDTSPGAYNIVSAAGIPSALNEVNRKYISNILTGYVNSPSKVIAYVLPVDSENLSSALSYLETQKANFVVGPPDCTAEQAEEIETWVIAQRSNKHYYKAVLPKVAADNEGVINFATSEIKVGQTTYTTAGYCGRIAGIIAGTPATISCTYAILPEVTDVERLTESAMDTAVDRGEIILFHDGEKVKVGRGVNSLVSTSGVKNEAWKKIKIVETIDMIQDDLRLLVQDNYFGKYSNTYDNKCLLITAISQYFAQLEADGVLLAGESVVEMDMEKQEKYLAQQGQDVSKMTEQQMKTANTGSKVFLRGQVSIPDTIEDLDLNLVF